MPHDKLVVFTDLDGTLLDARTYSFEPAAGALALLRKLGVPVVICTSKTAAEIMYWREKLDNRHPFCCENGGAVYIPRGYFPVETGARKVEGGYDVTEYGVSYRRLRDAVTALRERGFRPRGFGDMGVDEVAALTGLDMAQAALAKKREYDEPFVMEGGGEAPEGLLKTIEAMGLRYTKGRLMHVLGDNDKGKAVRHLAGLYARAYGQAATAALGDSLNDAPMLEAVDYPFLVRKPDGSHEGGVTDPRVVRVDGVGPGGWAEAVTALLKRLGLA